MHRTLLTQRPGTGFVGRAAIILAWIGVLGACGDAGRTATWTDGPAAEPLDTLLPVADTRLFVHAEGQGEPLVVVHGGPLLDHGYLVDALRPLGEELRLVFYDQRLSGRSDGQVDPDSVRLDRFVEDIEELRQTLGLGEIHLLGHSWGGLLAMKYALAQPEHLRSLVLMSPMAPSAALRAREQAALAASMVPRDTAGMGELRASLSGPDLEPETVARMLQLSFRSQLFDPTRAGDLEFEIPGDYADRSRQLATMAGDLTEYDLLADLEDLRVPTLLVYGESEEGREIGGRALRQAIPDLRFRVIPRAGHFSFLERPDMVSPLLRDFLRTGESGAGGR